tara:strand:+ start:45 stop:905 length:861 start_codon:yes stop_codon:yes gene_type:complete
MAGLNEDDRRSIEIPRQIAIDSTDGIVKCWHLGTNAEYIDSYKDLRDTTKYPLDVPVAIRSMASRKAVRLCEEMGRDYYYIDTGYVGNRQKRKLYHRVVKNGMQHSNFKEVPDDRWVGYVVNTPGLEYLGFPGWKKNGGPILVVTPSEKPCKFYGISRQEWLDSTMEIIKKHTDREIIVRDKGLRRDRVGDGSLYNQLDQDDIFAVVTYNSIAATEAVGYGVPAFTAAPGIADMLCEKDLSKIETPRYEDISLVQKWQHWVAYCQYNTREMANGDAYKLIQKHNLS